MILEFAGLPRTVRAGGSDRVSQAEVIMRFLVVVILVLLLAFVWWPRHAPPPVEETFIGDQIKPLRKAQQFQQSDYNTGLDEHRQRMDAQEAGDGG